MRTLQEKYNGIQEGKFTKEQFLVEARQQLPNLVTRYNGYNDAVQILKNRGMIQENSYFDSDPSDGDLDHERSMAHGAEKFYDNGLEAFKNGDLEKAEELYQQALDFGGYVGWDARELPPYTEVKEEVDTESEFDVIRGGRVIARNVKFFGNGRDYKVGNKVATLGPGDSTQPSTTGGTTDMINHIKASGGLQEARLTNKSLTDYRYKPTNDMDKYPYEQILRGLRVELEGLGVTNTPTPEEYTKALGKVLKNLEKDSIFYTNQVAGINKKVDLHDKMVDVKKDNAVDKFNGLKKAQLKEAIKGVIKNILTEENIPNRESKGPLEDFVKGWGTEVRRAASVIDTLLLPVDKGQELTDSIIELVASIVEEGPDEEEGIYEMQSEKSDSDYKNELADYLDDNQIYGYTNRIHDIMTGPDEAENVDELVRYLEDNQIYGYSRGIEAIYADYPYDQHYMNQKDKDDELYETVSLKDIL